MPISLKATYSSSSGLKLAAGQTWQVPSGSSGAGIGSVQYSGININTTNTLISLSGKYRVQYLSASGFSIGTPVTITVVIDGVTVFNGSITPSQVTLNILGIGSGDMSDGISVDSTLSITAQSTGVTSASVSAKILAEL